MSPDDSLDQIELKLKERPTDVSLLQHKVYVLIVLGRLAEAEAVLRRVDGLEKKRDADTTYLYIHLYHKRGNLKKAFEISDGAMKQFPENHYLWEIRGQVAKDAGKTEEAIMAMTECLRYRKTVNALNYIQITNILLERDQAGDRERTVALLQEGIARVDHPSELLHLSIRLHSELGRFDQALEDIDKLETQYGKQVPFAAKRAAVLEEVGRNAEAANVYRSAIALLEGLPENKQNKQVAHLKKVFQVAVDELSEMPDRPTRR